MYNKLLQFEWKASDGTMHKVKLGETMAKALHEAAEEDARQHNISYDDALDIIMNGLMTFMMVEEEILRN